MIDIIHVRDFSEGNLISIKGLLGFSNNCLIYKNVRVSGSFTDSWMNKKNA